VGNGFLLLGAIAAAFAVALSVAQVLIAQVSERNYGFGVLFLPGLVIGLALLALGGALRVLAAPKVPWEDPNSDEP
jgi:uncharacterized membrane protein (DUF441 family)